MILNKMFKITVFQVSNNLFGLIGVIHCFHQISNIKEELESLQTNLTLMVFVVSS